MASRNLMNEMKKTNLANQLSIWLVEWYRTFAFQNAMSNFTAENSSSEDNPCLFRMPLRVFFAFSFGEGHLTFNRVSSTLPETNIALENQWLEDVGR